MIEYLENAPWNISLLPGKPRLVPVGKILLAATVQESQTRGYDGRVGLHSLPQAESFYRSLGMTDFGTDHAYYGLNYFEFDSLAAQRWLREMET